jgi:hypothetical protein
VLHIDVVKIDQNVIYVAMMVTMLQASVPNILFIFYMHVASVFISILHMFHTYVTSIYLDVQYLRNG